MKWPMERLQQILDFLKETPQDPFLHYALTMEYVKLKQDDKALEGFEKLLRDFPDYIGTYYHFGKFLENSGNPARAADIYREGILIARAQRKMHPLSELQGALRLLENPDEDDDY